MEHIAYCDAKEKELQSLLDGTKTMLIRGAAGRKLPHGRVSEGEVIYLLENDGSATIRARAVVSFAWFSEKLTPEASSQIVKEHIAPLKLSAAQVKRWAGKRYLCLIGLADVRVIEPFAFLRTKSMDDWICIPSIKDVMA